MIVNVSQCTANSGTSLNCCSVKDTTFSVDRNILVVVDSERWISWKNGFGDVGQVFLPIRLVQLYL